MRPVFMFEVLRKIRKYSLEDWAAKVSSKHVQGCSGTLPDSPTLVGILVAILIVIIDFSIF
jgi:hypothetical protein